MKDYPSTVLLREKVLCPQCGAKVALRTLKFKHLCKNKNVEGKMEEKRAKLLLNAEEALHRRLAQHLQGPAQPDRLVEDPAQPDRLVEGPAQPAGTG